MYCNSICKGHDAENAVAELVHSSPKTNSVVALSLDSNGILYDVDAPLLLEIRPFAQYFPLKIVGEAVLRHSVFFRGELYSGPVAKV